MMPVPDLNSVIKARRQKSSRRTETKLEYVGWYFGPVVLNAQT